jgi:uncharacterized protein YndB with AHSA1/START domain
MMVEASIEIAAPVTRIWETFSDLSSWHQWNTVLRGVRYHHGSHLTVGTSFTCTIQPFGVPIAFEAVVTEAQPPRSVVWETRKPGLTARHSFLCEEGLHQVRVISREQFHGPAVRAAGPFFPAWRIRALTVALLRDLKTAAEG